jgi:NDP-sugar pyrophosphorylase family protein
MQIGDQLTTIVQSIVDEIKSKVDAELASTIATELAAQISAYDFDSKLAALAEPVVTRKIAEFPIDTAHINAEIGRIGTATITNLKDTIAAQVAVAAKEYVDNIDVVPLINSALTAYITSAKFPAGSIAAQAVNFNDFTLSGDHVRGGIIAEFGSTGIDDRATQCQLTILDNAVVVEQTVVATGLQIKGGAKISGDLTIDGELAADSSAVKVLTETIRDNTLASIAEAGVVAPKLVFNDKTIIDDKEIAPSVLKSNLRKVGTLEDLQTRGETLLDNTLYVSQKRVGVNTLEPTYALTVWDDDVEVAVNKLGKGRAFIGSHRPINVTLGANGKENLSLDIDGSVTINDLRLGALPLTTASTEPNWAGRAGEIAFNDSPKIGQPIGWVCLEGHRWAKFGIILE